MIAFSSVHIACADGGVLFVTPDRGVYSVGDTFDMQVMVATGGEAMNAAEADIRFDSMGLAVDHLSTTGSILSSWSTPPTFDNTKGTIRFAGWAGTKYNGTNGLLLTVTFKALRDSPSNARFAAGAILAADGKGSNIIARMHSASYTIAPKEVPVALDISADAFSSSPDPTVASSSDGTPQDATTTYTGHDTAVLPVKEVTPLSSKNIHTAGYPDDTSAEIDATIDMTITFLPLIAAVVACGLLIGYMWHRRTLGRIYGRRGIQ